MYACGGVCFEAPKLVWVWWCAWWWSVNNSLRVSLREDSIRLCCTNLGGCPCTVSHWSHDVFLSKLLRTCAPCTCALGNLFLFGKVISHAGQLLSELFKPGGVLRMNLFLVWFWWCLCLCMQVLILALMIGLCVVLIVGVQTTKPLQTLQDMDNGMSAMNEKLDSLISSYSFFWYSLLLPSSLVHSFLSFSSPSLSLTLCLTLTLWLTLSFSVTMKNMTESLADLNSVLGSMNNSTTILKGAILKVVGNTYEVLHFSLLLPCSSPSSSFPFMSSVVYCCIACFVLVSPCFLLPVSSCCRLFCRCYLICFSLYTFVDRCVTLFPSTPLITRTVVASTTQHQIFGKRCLV